MPRATLSRGSWSIATGESWSSASRRRGWRAAGQGSRRFSRRSATPPRAFGGAERAIAAAVEHLATRRTGTADGEEATGLMTHHLSQDEDTWRFVEHFIAQTKSHPAANWLAPQDVFGLTQ